MRTMRISSGGQVSIPAEVRRRWATETVAVDDLGDRLVLRPVPADPVAAARGAFRRKPGRTGEGGDARPLAEVRATWRREDEAATLRRYRRDGR